MDTHLTQNESEAAQMSPFAAERSSPVSHQHPAGRGRAGLIALIVGIIVVVTVATIFLVSYLTDPYRKLEEFPTGRYLQDYHALQGLKFRSDLRVEADLGWKDGVGRLMSFVPSSDTQPVVVFVPPKLANVFFNKGQVYTAELEVKDGGLIYASSFRKK